jgi:DNA-binding GntR family transcriptional regulator
MRVVPKKRTNKSDRIQKSLGYEAYIYLMNEITTFQIPVNKPLSESAIAQKLGISRTPVRDALKQLESEGLIKRNEKGSYFVSIISRKEIDEACDLLILCDTYLFSRAAERISQSDAVRLTSLAKNLVKSAKRDDREGWTIADLEFHEILMAHGDNSMVTEIARNARRRVHRYWARTSEGSQHLIDCSFEHSELAESIANGNKSAVVRLVEKHIEHLRHHVHRIVDMVAPAI